MQVLIFLCLGFVSLFARPVHADAQLPTDFQLQSVMSADEFIQFASDLAPQVNLFRDAWNSDTESIFYGGTVRDYLYFVLGQLMAARSKAELEQIKVSLRARAYIDVREFLYTDSDVDILSDKIISIRAENYGVAALDVKSKKIITPGTEEAQDEILQGYIPAEKILLTRSGVRHLPDMGLGAHEIYLGKLTVHFSTAEEFARSRRAQSHSNHPILMALRYLRLRALDYFRRYGRGYPDRQILIDQIPPEIDQQLKAIMSSVLQRGALKEYFAQANFKRWLNATLQKAFRSYTSPTAALLLMKNYRVLDLLNYYADVEPMDHLLFAQHRDMEKIRRAYIEFRTSQVQVTTPVSQLFADGALYHGTQTEAQFRNILIQGALDSMDGLAGRGLYGVDIANLGHAYGEPSMRIRFQIHPTAVIVDVTQGEGQKLWNEFKKRYGESYDKFAEYFGIDIVKYPWGTTKAFVVKNSEVLFGAQGVLRQILPLTQLFKIVPQIQDPMELLLLMSLNRLTSEEVQDILRESEISMADIELALDQEKNILRAINAEAHKLAAFRPLLMKAIGTGNHFENLIQGTLTEEQARAILMMGLAERKDSLAPSEAAAMFQLAQKQEGVLASRVFSFLLARPDFDLNESREKVLLQFLQSSETSEMLLFVSANLKNLTSRASEQFCFEVLALLMKKKKLDHIWIEGKGIQHWTFKSLEFVQKLKKILMDAVEAGQIPRDLISIVQNSSSEKIGPIVLRLLKSPHEHQWKEGVRLIEQGFFDAEVLPYCLELVEQNHQKAVSVMWAISSRTSPQINASAALIQKFWNHAQNHSSAMIRRLSLRVLSTFINAENMGETDYEKYLTYRALKFSFLEHMVLQLRGSIYASNALQEQKAAVSFLGKLQSYRRPQAEASLIEILRNKYMGSSAYFELFHAVFHLPASILRLQEIANGKENAHLAQRILQYQIERTQSRSKFGMHGSSENQQQLRDSVSCDFIL